MKRLVCVAAVGMALALCGAVPGKKFQSIPSGDVRVRSFAATAFDGIYGPDERVTLELSCVVTNGPVEAVLTVFDFDGRTLGTGGAKTLPDGESRTAFSLKAPRTYGHFTVQADLTRGGAKVGYTQTAIMTAPPEPAKRDPFFVIDKTGTTLPLAPSMGRLGFGSVFLDLEPALWACEAPKDQKERKYASYRAGDRPGNLGLKGFHRIGSVHPQVRTRPETRRRVENGLAPVSDADLLAMREHARKLAEIFKGEIDIWTIQEEYDAIPAIPEWKDEFLHLQSTYALVCENLTRGFKEGNPDCEVAVLGICCEDYMQFKPPFRYSKPVLATMRGLFDYIGIDGYTGGWNGAIGPFRPPEILLRQLLKDTVKLSVDYGGKPIVANFERCHALDYAAAFDSLTCREQAVLTARSMIVNRAVSESPYYVMFMLSYRQRADAYLEDTASALDPGKTLYDIGVWKTVRETPGGKDYFVPRPSAVAGGTVARELAFVKDPVDWPLARGAYACVFTREANAKPVAALWTTNSAPAVASDDFMGDASRFAKGVLQRKDGTIPVPAVRGVTLDLPSGGETVDLMGNVRPFAAGRLELTLNDAPVFVRYEGSREDLDRAILALRENANVRSLPGGGK